MVHKKFKELNDNFAKLQFFLEDAATPGSPMNQLLGMLFGPKKNQIMTQANVELSQIRDFYCLRFYSASEQEKSRILTRYQELYTTLDEISNGEISLEHARNKIQKSTESWGADIVFNNITYVCLAIACAIPLAAGIAFLPFVLPVIALNFCLGAAILTTATSSIILGITQCYNNLSNTKSTDPVRNNGWIELSFLNNMNILYSIKTPTETYSMEDNYDEAEVYSIEDNSDDYESDFQRQPSNYI